VKMIYLIRSCGFSPTKKIKNIFRMLFLGSVSAPWNSVNS
jgi:hypothetical protein